MYNEANLALLMLYGKVKFIIQYKMHFSWCSCLGSCVNRVEFDLSQTFYCFLL